MEYANSSTIKIASALKVKKFRQKYQLFMVEGVKIINELIDLHPLLIKKCLIHPDLKDQIIINKNVSYELINENDFKKISSLATSANCAAICIIPKMGYFNLNEITQPYEIVLDQINDPGNFGTILRTCDWFGINRIYVTPQTVDTFNPKTIQASMGSFFRVNVSVIHFDQMQKKLPKPWIGADLIGKPIQEFNSNFFGTLFIGSESHGIHPNIKQMLNERIFITKNVNSIAESLNAAIATGILLNHFCK